MTTTTSRLDCLIWLQNGETELVVRQGSVLEFDVQWGEGDDQVDIVAAAGMVKAAYADTEPLVNLTGWVTIVDGVAQVRVPASVTDDIESFSPARWDFEIELATGQQERVLEGPARYSPSVTR